MRELWHEIPSTDGRYEISNLGRVRSYADLRGGKLRRHRHLAPSVMQIGYKSLGLYIEGAARREYVHRLVAMSFVPGYTPGKRVNHIDGDKLNNRADNLEWVTARENAQHAVSLGLRDYGSNLADLTVNQVANILHMRGSISGRRLALSYGVGRQTIYRIWRGQTWRHVFAAEQTR